MSGIGQLLGRTLVLIAHPDDEAIGCGALLQRMRAPAVVFLTDGAPEDAYFWGRFGSRAHYAGIREHEARLALGTVRVSSVQFLRSVSDQQLHRHLQDAFSFLTEATERLRPDALLTLAYEGGHPDHDCCSFLAYRLGARFSLPVWEMPLYFRDPAGFQAQTEFLQSGEMEIIIEPTPEESARKRTMVAAYVSQGETLQRFTRPAERFRPQAAYDYSLPPHPGTLNYEAWGWKITGAEVCAAFARFCRHSQEAA